MTDLGKVVVLGSTGMLGREVVKQLGEANVLAPTRTECDISSWSSIEKYFARLKSVDAIINCAAYTAVDQAESDSAKAFAMNGSALHMLSRCADHVKSSLIHVSTDYVFDGEKQKYTITDIPQNPKSIYGKSKLLGEQYIQKNLRRYFIVRTSWLFGQHGKNFVKTILRNAGQNESIKVVSDQIGCPTYSVDLAKALISLIGSDMYGIHHAVGAGSCSWFDFAKTILDLKGIQKPVIPISTQKSFQLFPTIKASRPQSSILVNTLPMRPWKDALKEYLSHEI